MSTQCCFGYKNLVVDTATTVTATSEVATLPATNVKLRQCNASHAWQTADGILTATLTLTPALAQTVRGVGIFCTNLTNAATVTANAYTNPSTLVATVSMGAPVFRNRQSVGVFTADTVCDYVTIVISDVGNPDNHLSIPGVYAGALWLPSHQFSFNATIGRKSDQSINRAIAGASFVKTNFQSRVSTIEMLLLTESELWNNIEELMELANTGENIFASPDINSAYFKQNALFGILEATKEYGYPYGGADARSFTATHTERL